MSGRSFRRGAENRTRGACAPRRGRRRPDGACAPRGVADDDLRPARRLGLDIAVVSLAVAIERSRKAIEASSRLAAELYRRTGDAPQAEAQMRFAEQASGWLEEYQPTNVQALHARLDHLIQAGRTEDSQAKLVGQRLRDNPGRTLDVARAIRAAAVGGGGPGGGGLGYAAAAQGLPQFVVGSPKRQAKPRQPGEAPTLRRPSSAPACDSVVGLGRTRSQHGPSQPSKFRGQRAWLRRRSWWR